MTDIPKTRLQAFSIRDLVANLYAPPFFMPNVGMAVRAFGEDCKNPNSNLAKFPKDFELYHVGAYDEETGDFFSIPSSERTRLARATDYLSE